MNDETKLQLVAEQLEQVINDSKIEVPMLPEVANKALILSQDPESDATQMSKLIQSDQSLAGHVMRIANSVAYTPLTNLVSLQQAIARLGMVIISEIALSASIGAKLFNTPGYESHVAAQWKHALATGLWAREIARQNRSNVEVAFLAGLLHSIGRPAVLQTILEIAKKNAIELSADEVAQLENQYQHQVSELVVRTWQMPNLVIAAVSDYQNYQDSETAATQAAQVNAGIEFAHYMLSTEQDSKALLNLPVLASLNLYQDEIESLIANTESVSERLKELAS